VRQGALRPLETMQKRADWGTRVVMQIQRRALTHRSDGGSGCEDSGTLLLLLLLTRRRQRRKGRPQQPARGQGRSRTSRSSLREAELQQ
jgi:hypothetical protein